MNPFLLYDTGAPRWVVNTLAEGKCLDVAGARVDNGTELIQWTWNGGPQQHFYFTPLRNNLWLISACHSGRVVEVEGNGDAGARVIQWPFHGGPNQLWRFEHRGGHRGLLINQGKGLVLDVKNGSVDAGAPILVVHRNDTQGQLFKPFTRRPDGTEVFLDEFS